MKTVLGLLLILILQLSMGGPLAFATTDDDSRLGEIEQVLNQNKYVNVPRDCLEHVLMVEKKASRQLEPGELVWAATTYMESQGSELERRRCFTCRMEVLTPLGYRRIDQLKVGSRVLSWDVASQKLVINRVKEIHKAENVAYGELQNHANIAGAFEVTPDHPFFLPDKLTSLPLSQIAPIENLQKVMIGRNDCHFLLEPRGPFVMRGTATVMTITLAGAPNNFIVNGIVVQNKPSRIT